MRNPNFCKVFVIGKAPKGAFFIPNWYIEYIKFYSYSMKKFYIVLIVLFIGISGYLIYSSLSKDESSGIYTDVSVPTSEILNPENRKEIGSEIYIAQEGETLESIAADYGITVKTIEDNNDIDPKGIYAGHSLIIPPADGLLVVVTEGDTIEGLAEEYSVKASDIADANWLDTPYELEIDSLIFIPGASL
jgi:LysM repeat protein